MGAKKGKVGDRYGYLTIIEETEKRSRNGDVFWKFRCDCGKELIRGMDSITQSINKGCIISCGCQKPKRDIGNLFANDPNRKDLARKSLGQIDGTTIQGIDRKNLNKNNKSGVRGVCYKTREQRWQAEVFLRGKAVERKYFDNKEDAIAWRQHLEKKYFDPIKKKYKEEVENND